MLAGLKAFFVDRKKKAQYNPNCQQHAEFSDPKLMTFFFPLPNRWGINQKRSNQGMS